MRKIKIVTDSSCDLNSEIIQKYNIEIVPLNVSFGDKIYEDGYIEKSEFYEMMDNMSYDNKTICSDGITLDGTTFSNSGVRGIASGSTNGTISVESVTRLPSMLVSLGR